jgi:hypothetical protein
MKRQLLLISFLASLATGFTPAFAKTTATETLIIFDNPHLIATASNKGIRGYFNTEHQRLNFSCAFFFEETGRQADSTIGISSFPIQGRTKEEDIPGRVWAQNGEWIIQTDEPHAGCGGAVGTFYKGPGDDHPTRYSIARKIPAIGIRIVLRATKLKGRTVALAAGDVVAALEENGAFSRIRYVHPATGDITTAWVRTRNLGNPFSPSANKIQ